MDSKKTENTPLMTPRRHSSDSPGSDLKSGRIGAEKQPARPPGESPGEVKMGKNFECICSNCGHIVPTVEDVQCPPCPVCAGPMEAV